MPRLHEVMQQWDAILVGGQALRPALAEQAREAGYRVIRTYGSSETAGGCVWDGVALPGVNSGTSMAELLCLAPCSPVVTWRTQKEQQQVFSTARRSVGM